MCFDGRLAAHSPGIIYASHLIFLMAVDLNNMPSRLIDEGRDGKYPRLAEPAFGDDTALPIDTTPTGIPTN
jgi:hypothetical protein